MLVAGPHARDIRRDEGGLRQSWFTLASFRPATRSMLFSVAPDLEGGAIDPDTTFREQLEIVSMDFTNFVIGLSKAIGQDIPEIDYPEFETLGGAVAYLRSRVP
jgi:acyl carrier protein